MTKGCPLHFGIEKEDVGIAGAAQLEMVSVFLERRGEVASVQTLQPAATFQRASWWLRLLARRLNEHNFRTVHIVLVDIPLWSRVQADSTSTIDIDIEKPVDPSNVLMLTETSLNAIVTKQLTLLEATELGIARWHALEDDVLLELRAQGV
ncbi:hypothetical protein ACPV5O_09810 [Vibrio maritimus]|uniref:hypothetical protein n=1 Tax=Vibrio maritimus TaxID=990268 RepID=UPI004067E1D9